MFRGGHISHPKTSFNNLITIQVNPNFNPKLHVQFLIKKNAYIPSTIKDIIVDWRSFHASEMNFEEKGPECISSKSLTGSFSWD